MTDPYAVPDLEAALPDPLHALFIGAQIDGHVEPTRPVVDQDGTEGDPR